MFALLQTDIEVALISKVEAKGDLRLKYEWGLYPNCNSKTRVKKREDTVLENLPLFCPKKLQKTA